MKELTTIIRSDFRNWNVPDEMYKIQSKLTNGWFDVYELWDIIEDFVDKRLEEMC